MQCTFITLLYPHLDIPIAKCVINLNHKGNNLTNLSCLPRHRVKQNQVVQFTSPRELVLAWFVILFSLLTTKKQGIETTCMHVSCMPVGKLSRDGLTDCVGYRSANDPIPDGAKSDQDQRNGATANFQRVLSMRKTIILY